MVMRAIASAMLVSTEGVENVVGVVGVAGDTGLDEGISATNPRTGFGDRHFTAGKCEAWQPPCVWANSPN